MNKQTIQKDIALYKSSHALPSYLQPDNLGPWGTFLNQVDRVTPYLGDLSRWVETLKRPKKH